jgi:SAM-dependent methyltransferase
LKPEKKSESGPRLGLKPGQMMEISGSYWKSCALHAAVKLDVFTAIGKGRAKSTEIAGKLGTDSRGLTVLLDALAAMDLLIKSDDRYSNTPNSETFLSKESPEYMGYIIMHHQHLVESWGRLDQAVQTGRPVRSGFSFKDDIVRESFLMGMFNMAMGLAPRVVEAIDLSDRSYLLDLGGGPGTYAIHFCLHNPELKAKVYDLPTTRPFAEKTIERFGLTGRVAFEDCNYLTDSIDETFDAVWLSHILHGEGPEACRMIIRKAVSSVKPGGRIIIHDFILNNTMDGPLFPALFSLNMLVGTKHGRSYSEEQIREMLSSAGVTEIERIPLETANDSGIIAGTV